MKHVLFVYNPVAGVGRVRKNLYEIIEFYDANNCLVTLCPVRRLEDYFDILGLYEKRYDVIVCSGGDGTLNLMLSFFRQKGIKEAVAYVPSGSTNDYAYSLGISDDFKEALRNTLHNQIRDIDIGVFNDKYFLYVAAFGIFTKVAYSTPQKTKNLLGHTAYILEGIKQISDLKSYYLTVKAESKAVSFRFILGLVTNTLSVGGFKNIMPNDVALDDGKFEAIFIKEPSNLMELHGIISSLLGEKLEDNPQIVYCKTEKIEIIAEEEIDWTLDGEYGGKYKEIEIVNLKQELSVIV